MQPGQETAIEAKMDTNRFQRQPSTITIYVSFDKPHREEVRLWVQANSREDVTFSPDNIAFGHASAAAPRPRARVTVTFLGGAETQNSPK